MAAAENGTVTHLHLAFRKVVERTHDAIFVLPRNASATPAGYAADILQSTQDCRNLASSLPEEVSTWTDEDFEKAFQEVNQQDEEATAKLRKLLPKAEECQRRVRVEIEKTVQELCGPMLTIGSKLAAVAHEACQCGEKVRPGALFCGACGRKLTGPIAPSDATAGQLEVAQISAAGLAKGGAPDANAALHVPQPVLKELLSDNRRRFSEELEFLLLLADPLYVHWLALQGYLEDEAFVNFLKHMQYWRAQPYVQWVIYPQALRMLEMLQDPVFRVEVRQKEACEWLRRQNSYRSQVPEIVAPRKASATVPPTSSVEASAGIAGTGGSISSASVSSSPVPPLPEKFRPLGDPAELAKWTPEKMSVEKAAQNYMDDCVLRWEKNKRQHELTSEEMKILEAKLLEANKVPDGKSKMHRYEMRLVDKIKKARLDCKDPGAGSNWRQLLAPVADPSADHREQLVALCNALRQEEEPGFELPAAQKVTQRSVQEVFEEHDDVTFFRKREDKWIHTKVFRRFDEDSETQYELEHKHKCVAEPSQLRRRLFEKGDCVQYLSVTNNNTWIDTVVVSRSEKDGASLYNLEIKPAGAKAAQVRAKVFEPGDCVQYYSKTKAEWIDGKVIRGLYYNTTVFAFAYDLDVKENVHWVQVRKTKASAGKPVSVVSGVSSGASGSSRGTGSLVSRGTGALQKITSDSDVMMSASGGASSSMAPGSANEAQAAANAMDPTFHGEWQVNFENGKMYGKAYVLPSGSYLTPRKAPEIRFSIVGLGTEESPYRFYSKKMKALLFEKGQGFLRWQMHGGTDKELITRWTRLP